jgi:hypothetical protein
MSFSDDAFFGALSGPTPGEVAVYGNAGVGEALEAAGGIVDSVANAALGGVAQQNEIHIMARNNVDKLGWTMSGLDRLFRERHQAAERLRAAIRWMDNKRNKRRWITAGLASAGRNAPDQGVCDNMFEGIPLNEFYQVEQGRGNPGGHAEWVPHCRCPYEKCAYKPSEHVKWDTNRLIGRDAQIRLESIDWGNPPLLPALGPMPARIQAPPDGLNGGLAGVGNIADWRSRAVSFWSFLMSLEGNREVVWLNSGTPVLWKSELLLAPATLGRLFASREARPDGWTADPEAARGIVPAHVGAGLIQQSLSMYALGLAPADIPVPLWALGFDKTERDRYVIGPTVGQVAQVNKRTWGDRGVGNISAHAAPRLAPPVYGSVNPAAYGAAAPAATPGNLRGILKSLVEQGRMATVPVAPPSVVPGAVVVAAPVQTPEDRALIAARTAEADKPIGMSTPVKVAIGVGAGATILGMTALIASSFRRPA